MTDGPRSTRELTSPRIEPPLTLRYIAGVVPTETLLDPHPTIPGPRPAPEGPERLCPALRCVVERRGARVRAEGKACFLHVSKPEIDSPPTSIPMMRRSTPRGRTRPHGRRGESYPRRRACPYYVYRLTRQAQRHRPCGYRELADRLPHQRRIRKHELTTPLREEDQRVDQIEAVNAQTVMIAYPSAPAIDAMLADNSRACPRSTSPGRTASATSSGRSATRRRSMR